VPKGAGEIGGDERLKVVGNYRLGDDSRRQALVAAATAASKNLPPGWRVEAFSGQRDGRGQGPHSHSGAIDFRIIKPGPNGGEVMLDNYQNPKTFAAYEKFAQDTHAELLKTNPKLAAQHRFGGYFSGQLGPGGTYGAMDTMHQDFGGGDSRMAAGKWATGLDPEWRRRWGVQDYSAGFAERRSELDRAIVDKQNGGAGVSASGGVDLDVKAPAGTTVEYNGDKLLAARKTERRTEVMTEENAP